VVYGQQLEINSTRCRCLIIIIIIIIINLFFYAYTSMHMWNECNAIRAWQSYSSMNSFDLSQFISIYLFIYLSV
jgi:hypothetical protein